MSIIILFGLLFTLMLMGVPIAFSLGLSSVVTIAFFSSDSLSSVALKLWSAMDHYTLLAIPFFILSSSFLTNGGVARRLVDLTVATTGHLKGGVAISGVFACVIFAALSGSSPATVVAIGSMAIAGMVKGGYSKSYAAGLICNSGTLGILIPPSIVLVVYAASTDTSVGQLFMAGLVPGLLMGLVLAIAVNLSVRRMKIVMLPRASWVERFQKLRKAFWGLLLILIILGGIYGGIFTPTEAASVAAVYAWAIAVFVHRDVGPYKPQSNGSARSILTTIKLLPSAIFGSEVRAVYIQSARTSIMLMFIIANAILFAHVLTTERIPHVITEWVLASGFEKIAFLLVVNILLLVAGNFMEPSAIILIMAPILLPIALKLGVHPVHLGIIMTINMEIGLVSPPVGLNLFVTSAVAKMSLPDVIRAAMPWLSLLVLFLLLVTYVPSISTFLPSLLYDNF